MMKLYIPFAAAALCSAGNAAALYNAALGTLPQAQGFTYSGDNGNPLPFVSGGLLHENTTAGNQFWLFSDPLDFSGHITLQASLRVNSSNEVPNVGTGTREGYYFVLDAANGDEYSIGLADSGFNINTVTVPNHPLTPFPIAGVFHLYEFDINNNLGSFVIDGTVMASNISPKVQTVGATSRALFGGSAGASMSNTDLAFFCETTVTSCAPAATVPEPSSTYLALASLAALWFRRLR